MRPKPKFKVGDVLKYKETDASNTKYLNLECNNGINKFRVSSVIYGEVEEEWCYNFSGMRYGALEHKLQYYRSKQLNLFE